MPSDKSFLPYNLQLLERNWPRLRALKISDSLFLDIYWLFENMDTIEWHNYAFRYSSKPKLDLAIRCELSTMFEENFLTDYSIGFPTLVIEGHVHTSTHSGRQYIFTQNKWLLITSE